MQRLQDTYPVSARAVTQSILPAVIKVLRLVHADWCAGRHGVGCAWISKSRFFF